MFNLFKSQANSIETSVQTITAPKKIHVTAREIHEDFYSEAKLLLSSAVNNELKIKAERYERLLELGLTRVKDYQECYNASRKIALNKTALLYSDKYPNYKFISEVQVEALCKKYGLLLGHIGVYIGEIPDKNLNDLSRININSDDDPCIQYDDNWYTKKEFESLHGIKNLNKVVKASGMFIKIGDGDIDDSGFSPYAKYSAKAADHLKIAATPDMFDMYRKEVKSGYKIVDKDPVVFYSVKDGYLIITAWGDEASISEIVNEKMN